MAVNKSDRRKLEVVKPPVRISLALQGGGTHGAFTWGVLDYILDQDNISIDGISGISTGAVNALVLATGLAKGGKKEAQKLLKKFWDKVALSASLSPFQPTMVDRMLGNTKLTFSPSFMALDFITSVFSPYQFNLFDFNPIRDIISEVVDFKAIKHLEDPKIFLGATNVKTGKHKIFKNGEISMDSALATTCLPYIFKTATVGGEGYWEGGFTGNPSLRPLVSETDTKDIFIVQTIPFSDNEIPTKATDILDRANEISFNSSLTQEIRQINFVNKLIETGRLSPNEFRKINVHVIEASEIIAALGRSSKLNADSAFIEYLRDAGRQAAEDWFRSNYSAIGAKSTISPAMVAEA